MVRPRNGCRRRCVPQKPRRQRIFGFGRLKTTAMVEPSGANSKGVSSPLVNTRPPRTTPASNSSDLPKASRKIRCESRSVALLSIVMSVVEPLNDANVAFSTGPLGTAAVTLRLSSSRAPTRGERERLRRRTSDMAEKDWSQRNAKKLASNEKSRSWTNMTGTPLPRMLSHRTLEHINR